MEQATVEAMIQRYWNPSVDMETSHEMYHEDAVLEFPQSQERFEGKASFMAWRAVYPAEVAPTLKSIRGAGNLWVVELTARYDGGPVHYGCGILEFRDGKVALETIYVGEGWEAPDWRAPWRAEWREKAVTEVVQ